MKSIGRICVLLKRPSEWSNYGGSCYHLVIVQFDAMPSATKLASSPACSFLGERQNKFPIAAKEGTRVLHPGEDGRDTVELVPQRRPPDRNHLLKTPISSLRPWVLVH